MAPLMSRREEYTFGHVGLSTAFLVFIPARPRAPDALQHERTRRDAAQSRGSRLLVLRTKEETGVPGLQRVIACRAAPGTRGWSPHAAKRCARDTGP